MALNVTIQQIGAAAMAAAATHLAIHTAQPDAAGSNQSSAARKASGLTATNGDLALSGTVSFTGGAASGPATHLGFWSAITGGTFYGWMALTGDQTFNAAGEYNVTAATLDGTMS